jgi:RNA polymerase sigma factor (sigma-70 family)
VLGRRKRALWLANGTSCPRDQVKIIAFPVRPGLASDREEFPPDARAEPARAPPTRENPDQCSAGGRSPAEVESSPQPRTRKTIRRRRRWFKRPSPAAVIARAIEPPARLRRGDASAAESVREAKSPTRQQVFADAAFWQIWLTHRDYLYRRSLRFSSGNAAEAEDAMSEAMLKAAQAFGQVEIRNHRAWLLRLVHNACMDRYRVNERHNRLVSDIAADDGQSIPAIVPKHNRSPEELLDALEVISCLQRAMTALPRSLAEPLLLYLDDISDAEIAGSLNISKDVVRKRRQMARDWLRRQMLL